ncbi:alpha-glucosidase/alpha-galactosidase [Candidatus Bathyarchaeota archaeon]|nr:MAG: alpha-glucosidase/alpha-galactosidase [Candidatus Bathyarchaeota archaeon]
MVKIVMIGAGSHVFAKNLIVDFLSYPELRDSTITLMDIDPERLNLTAQLAKKIVDQYNFKTKIEATTDRKEALRDADYVVISIRVGGMEATRLDLEIPAKYGIEQAVGDTLGPGGVFYGLKHIPVILDICHEMERLCPDALLMNYTNPMAMICWAVNDYSDVKNVGLCHSVQGTARQLARYIGAPPEEVSYWVAGINHMAWFLEFKWKGEDAYPLLRKRFDEVDVEAGLIPEWAESDLVRIELFKAFGYFITESSQHLSEYVPYLRKRMELIRKFRVRTAAERLQLMDVWRARSDEQIETLLKSEEKIPIRRSGEYCSYIIHCIETDTHGRINGNVKNTGLITNLPQGCCVEVPCLVDGNGIHPCYVGDLPPQCAALNRTNVNVQELGMRAAVNRDKELAFQALLLDPLTTSILSISETRRMVEEMFEAEAEYLQGFK